jgi:hypothetical protein
MGANSGPSLQGSMGAALPLGISLSKIVCRMGSPKYSSRPWSSVFKQIFIPSRSGKITI